MPNVRSLTRLRPLLPYAVKLLPILRDIAIPAAGARQDPGVLDRQFGAMQSESRGLRSQVEGQGEQISRMVARLEQIATTLERADRERAELAGSLRGAATLMRRLLFATILLLIVVATISIFVLLRLPHSA